VQVRTLWLGLAASQKSFKENFAFYADAT